MTALKFAADAKAAGLQIDVQEVVPWGSHDLISCFSLFHRPQAGVALTPAPEPIINNRFWEEVRTRAQVERLYGRPAAVLPLAPRRGALGRLRARILDRVR